MSRIKRATTIAAMFLASVWSASHAQPAPSFQFTGTLPHPVGGPAAASPLDAFGTRIAHSGSLLVVGVARDQVDNKPEQGAVYVFQRAGAGWERIARLTAQDGFAGQGFGSDVALSGNVLVVGANNGRAARAPNSEAATYVYERQGADWRMSAKLRAPGNPNDDPNFGSRVAISGDVILVGSYDAIGGVGRVFSYRRNGIEWLQDGVVTGPSGEPSFGYALAIDASLAVIGAPLSTTAPEQQGAAYVYQQSAAVWVSRGSLIVGNRAGIGMPGFFGLSVAIAGNSVLVGAPLTTTGSVTHGAAIHFASDGDNWLQDAPPLVGDIGVAQALGIDVALSEGRALIGASATPNHGLPGVGMALVFLRENDKWRRTSQLVSDSQGAEQGFGGRVLLGDGIALIGAPGEDSLGSTPSVGAVYTFAEVGASGWQQLHRLQLPDGESQDKSGYRIAVDGDTMLVASPSQERGDIDFAGMVHVYRRRQGAWQHEAELVGPTTPEQGDWFGWAIALKGDTALVGAPFVDGEGTAYNAGAAYVFVRNGTSWTRHAELRAPDHVVNDNFGASVSIDAQSEIRALIGAWRGSVGPDAPDSGSAYLFEREGDAWSMRQELTPTQPTGSDFFGYAVSLDGARAYVSSPYENVDGIVDTGAVRIFALENLQWIERTKLVIPVSLRHDGDNFGFAIAAERIGDRTTLYASAPGASLSGVFEGGGVFLAEWFGADTTMPALVVMPSPPGLVAGDRLGNALSVRGGHLLVGAPFADGPPLNTDPTPANLGNSVLTDSGAAFFYPYGDAFRAQRLDAGSGQARAAFGWGLAVGMLHDGYPLELMIGAPYRDASVREESEAPDRGGVDVFDSRTLLLDGFESR